MKLTTSIPSVIDFDENTRVSYPPGARGVPTLSEMGGGVFKPDGTGGGTLTFEVVVQRPGFRSKVVQKTIRKECHRGA